MTNLNGNISRRRAGAFAAALALVAGLLALSPATVLAQAGYVHEVSGAVTASRLVGASGPVRASVTFEAGTTFVTGEGGRVELKFADGQVLAVGPNSTVRVERYRYDAKDLKRSGVAIALANGTMRVITGAIGADNRQAMSVTAGASVVTITRSGGADYTLVVDTRAQEVGVAAVIRGEISVRTPYGIIARIEAGQFGPWQPGRAPPLPMPLAAMPAVVHASVTALAVLALPANTPVAIDNAARIAMATPAQGRAGYVEAVSGTVSAQTATGEVRSVQVGDTFDLGTIFDTGQTGRVVLKFTDGQILVLGPDSALQVDQYRFDPRNARASGVALALLNGAMRFVGGVIANENPRGVRITAGESLVTILKVGGVDFTVEVNTKKADEFGSALVTIGEVSVLTPYGPIRRIVEQQTVPWGPGGEFKAMIAAMQESLPAVEAAPAPPSPALPPSLPAAPSYPGAPIPPISSPGGGGGGCLGSPC